MDARLGAIFKLRADQKAGGREAAAALLQLRFRALSLLEEFAKRAPNSPLLLAAVVPLLRALSRAARPSGNAELAKKLRAVVVNRLARCRPAAPADGDEAAAEEVGAALQKALYYAGRDKGEGVNEAAGAHVSQCLKVV